MASDSRSLLMGRPDSLLLHLRYQWRHSNHRSISLHQYSSSRSNRCTAAVSLHSKWKRKSQKLSSQYTVIRSRKSRSNDKKSSKPDALDNGVPSKRSVSANVTQLPRKNAKTRSQRLNKQLISSTKTIMRRKSERSQRTSSSASHLRYIAA